MNAAKSFALQVLALAACAGEVLAQEARARLEFDPASAEVGQPVRASVTVEHDAKLRPKLDSLGLDESWLVLDSKPGPTLSDAATGRARTRFEFEVVSLEPGERSIAKVPLMLGDQTLAVDSAALSVQGLLAEGEDSPRALKGLREIQTADERANLWLWGGGALALVAAAVAIALAVWRKRSRPKTAAAPAPSVRLAVLESRPLDTPADVQAAHFALTRLLRESADLRAGRDRSAMTDEEWRSAARAQFEAAGLSDTEESALIALLERAATVKYGIERPTHWATREALASARTLAVRLEPGEEPKRARKGVAA